MILPVKNALRLLSSDAFRHAFTFGVPGLLVLIAAWQVWSEANWKQSSAPVVATVIETIKNSPGYRCRYRFQTDAGETVIALERFAHRQETAVGTTARLRYRISDPTVVRDEDNAWVWSPAILTGAAILWMYTVRRNFRGSRPGAEEEMVRPRIRKLPR